MKISLIALSFIILCSCGVEKTIVKGRIITPESVKISNKNFDLPSDFETTFESNEIKYPDYLVFVETKDEEGNKIWKNWPVWSYYDTFEFEVVGDEVGRAIFVDPCTSEVYAKVLVKTVKGKKIIHREDIVLDGSEYVFSD